MSCKFTRAPLVNPGDLITSKQHNALAEAWNSRLVSGVGNCTYRVHYFFECLFRNLRMPDGDSYEAVAEALETLSHIPPDSALEYPEASPAMPQGANLANLLNQFVFGAEGPNLDDEGTRTEQVIIQPTTPDAAGLWELAKAQRGAVDVSGAFGSPIMEQAREIYKIINAPAGEHGYTFGGYAPGPAANGECPEIELGLAQVWTLPFFTNLNDGSKLEYPGNCMQQEGHLAYVAPQFDRYLVYVWTAEQTVALDRVLLYSEWIEGPYSSNPQLRKNWGHHMERVLDYFLKDFRGTPAQRAVEGTWLDNAFDFQRFFESQYLLAPQIGTVAIGSITPYYPFFAFADAFSDLGTLGKFNNIPKVHSYSIHAGFVMAGVHCRAKGLTAPCTVEVLIGGNVVGSFAIAPDDHFNASATMILPAFQAQNISVRAATEIYVRIGGEVRVELLELWNYKPQVHDAAIFMRLAATNDSMIFEGRGVDETMAKEIFDLYWSSGALVNVHNKHYVPMVADSVNTNPVYDAARRMSRWIRVLNRQQFLGIELVGGKHILYFKRINGISRYADQFDGIAPKRESIPSGLIVKDTPYLVEVNAIVYEGKRYNAGEYFTGGATKTYEDVPTRQPDGSYAVQFPGVVKERYGIRHTAPPGGESNEWVLDVCLMPFKNDENSIFKAESYGDHYFHINKCLVGNSWRGGARDIAVQLSETHPTYFMKPEGPDSLTYARGLNAMDYRYDHAENVNAVNFNKACRVYEPPVAVEQTEVIWEGGIEVVKVTLSGRLHHCDEAFPGFGRDVSKWNLDALQAEPYRSVENGIRQYQIPALWAHYKPGDFGRYVMSDSGFDPRPHCSILPRFFFTQLIPKVVEDGNDTVEETDSPFLHDSFKHMATVARAISEGFIDGISQGEAACIDGINGGAYDFTWENLCMAAFGKRGLSLIPGERDDNPVGFGPYPNTDAMAQTYNELAACVNLLTRARLPFPYLFETRTRNYQTQTDVVPTILGGTGGIHYAWMGAAPKKAAEIEEDPAWVSSPGWSSSAGVTLGYDGARSTWVKTDTQTTAEWRVTPLDPLFLYALPDTIRDLVSEGSLTLIAKTIKTVTSGIVATVATEYESDCCMIAGACSNWAWNSTDGGRKRETVYNEQSGCGVIPAFGELPYEAAPGGDIVYITTGQAEDCTGGGSSRVTYMELVGDPTVSVEIPCEDYAGD